VCVWVCVCVCVCVCETHTTCLISGQDCATTRVHTATAMTDVCWHRCVARVGLFESGGARTEAYPSLCACHAWRVYRASWMFEYFLGCRAPAIPGKTNKHHFLILNLIGRQYSVIKEFFKSPCTTSLSFLTYDFSYVSVQPLPLRLLLHNTLSNFIGWGPPLLPRSTSRSPNKKGQDNLS
jgi:hypothetical protein